MEFYWLKGGNKELVTKRLDDELEDYFSKHPEAAPKEADAKAEGGDAA